MANSTVAEENFRWEPKPDCVDVYGPEETSNNPTCFKNLQWAIEEAQKDPDNYPEGSRTLPDLQCALYLKFLDGFGPDAYWNCTKPPCAPLAAPMQEHGSVGKYGTDYCKTKVLITTTPEPEPSIEACSVVDGTAVSAVYPCTCHVPEQVCQDEQICGPAPTYCNTTIERSIEPVEMEMPKPEPEAPVWPWILLTLGIVAAIVAAVVFAYMKFKSPRKPAVKRAIKPAPKPAPAPPPPAPEPVYKAEPVYTVEPIYAAPVPTAAVPLPSYSPSYVVQQAAPVYQYAAPAAPAAVSSVSVAQPMAVAQQPMTVVQQPMAVAQQPVAMPTVAAPMAYATSTIIP